MAEFYRENFKNEFVEKTILKFKTVNSHGEIDTIADEEHKKNFPVEYLNFLKAEEILENSKILKEEIELPKEENIKRNIKRKES